MGDEKSLDAEEHVNFLEYVLKVYDKSLHKVVALVGDNCSTNKRIAKRYRL